MIEISPGKKKIYRAVPVDIALNRIINEMTTYKDELSEYVKVTEPENTKYNPYLWYMDNVNLIREQMKNMIINAETEIIVSFLPPENLWHILFLCLYYPHILLLHPCP